ncbi:cobalt ABC transporter ATPase [Thermosipho melanesiensis]|uniref:ABC transporter related n=2 Tax=Thermosipho melanesiensis TaxID=46541 RepID=A6LKX8_THEM4|nr:ABC transporter ATP-binding protein [Thermosipho melanesiensis]ABR30579.1 ABC transporter related [Thermosipho melanesiensis BI429]APT73727.1 cobalt ABC transporter ATPase [Thermosipho melanesiensis]OOC35665.1 cobalt ABC transporter ATPase [Thermosipho melanesiensis]OOC38964.1 cobalt ABC transporter ATPase [Thermosipho melanesiensis]OOC39112.1 cobalt ABC transporter ATPase [Thermosipho melanesiensis]
MIELKNISFGYDKEYVLENVTLCFPKNKKIAILGNNGCGKTTLLLICSGLLKPKKGKIYLDNTLVKNKELRKKVGIVFQNPDTQLLPVKVYQDISFGLFNLGYEKSFVEKRVKEIIKEFEMESLKDKPTQFLSYGQKKLVSIADIVALNPEYILLDEPDSYLDYKSFIRIQKILDKLLKKGKTIVISTHNSDFAYQWADYVYIIDNKKVILEGNPSFVFSKKDILEKTNLKIPGGVL